MNPIVGRTAFFAERVREQPENVLFRFSYGQALVNDSRAAEALPHLQIAADSRSDWMVARILLGKAHQAAGDAVRARRAYEEALALAVSQGHEDPEEELRSLIAGLS